LSKIEKQHKTYRKAQAYLEPKGLIQILNMVILE